MPVDRFYLDANFEESSAVIIEGNEHHHLARVVRIETGEVIELINGRGALAQGRVAGIDKHSARVTIESLKIRPPPEHKIILIQAIPRMNRLEWIIEKGTELGMAEIWLFPGIHSEKKELTPHQHDRLTTIAIGAMKQSGRLYLPLIHYKEELKKWKSVPEIAYFGDVRPDSRPLHQLEKENPSVKNVHFFVGPESGFAPAEELWLRENGAIGVSLNPHILRTDTAAVAALTLLAHFRECFPG